MNLDEEMTELVQSGFISSAPKIIKEPIASQLGKLSVKLSNMFSPDKRGFDIANEARFNNRQNSLSVGDELVSEHTKNLFTKHGFTTPAEKFVLFHEIAHKRLHETLPKLKSAICKTRLEKSGR